MAKVPGGKGARVILPDDGGLRQELELGAVYAKFPMKRLGKPLAPADMARLAAVATREARRSAKVAAAVVAPPPTPLQAEDAAPRLRLDEMVDDEAVAADMNVYKHRLSSERSRRPTLETIQEENYMSTN
ncbi:hypothetical protein OsJ_19474 [Oryza sativa Japonica Group]|uniref:Uncharacterized protein n=1 Tax=Oryza sativa subsp. japonica TaxID=39947 RepID=B9FLI2_ORYSJ|nr:hypothetical protein OsJ_19474 [Oryza sativa Japonica Group]